MNNKVLGVSAIIDEGTLANSAVEVKYNGFNNYTIWLFRKDGNNNRVNSSFEIPPVIRITDEWNYYNLFYCPQVKGYTMGGNDIVEQILHYWNGIHFYTFSHENKSGIFVPLIYYEFNDKISMYKFFPASNMKSPDGL